MRHPRTRVWFGDMWERAEKMLAEGVAHKVIATELGVQPRQLEFKIRNEHGHNKRLSPGPSPDALRDRELREAAADRRGLTQTFFGDPPPGYSALDQKRQQQAKA